MEKSVSDLETLTASLKGTDNTLQRELDAIKDATDSLSLKLTKLHQLMIRHLSDNKVNSSSEGFTVRSVQVDLLSGKLCVAIAFYLALFDYDCTNLDRKETTINTTNLVYFKT